MYKRLVLIVDDQEINREILSMLLADEYKVLCACNGQEALQILKDKADSISAVILDIIMPIMNGYDVLKAMQEDVQISKIPVIVSSQKDGDSDEVKALELGAQDYIAKPYKPDIIKRRLKNIINLRETAAIVNKTERDDVTGLFNKQFFLQKLQMLLRENPNTRYDIVCVGIERFKLINDTYGNRYGDKVLSYVGEALLELCKATGICGRFMADFFYGVLPHNEVYTNKTLQPMYDKVGEYPIDMEIKLHCGIYMIQDVTMTLTAMCDRAQLAADKNRGKYDTNFYLYDESLRDSLVQEQFIISHMQTAIDNREFVIYYQPKYELSSEQIAGAEALVRWIHPERGFMSPGDFIPIFENNGFISKLDYYVWETACRDIRSWMDQGYPPVSISVNVSRADIYHPKLIDKLLGLVAKYKIPIQYLHLEITESAYAENPQQIIDVVGKLREYGFSIEMDDFGSGYSSLNMLAEMPVDILKLDMGFIQSETGNNSGKGILSFVISLAKWLNLAVVAEGVETKEQVMILRSMDCNYVQGYYYSRPIPMADFENLLKTSQTTEMVCTTKTAVEYFAEKKNLVAPISERVMLIVDDMELNRVSLAAIFGDIFHTVEVSNGREAWDYLQTNYEQVAIVMTDLLMPEMDGFQLLTKINEDERTAQIPVIVTAHGDADVEQRVLMLHAADFISRPYNKEILRHRVGNVVERATVHKIRQEELTKEEQRIQEAVQSGQAYTYEEKVQQDIERRRGYFDLVRLVDPRDTIVYEPTEETQCDMHSCFSVWGKTSRCNNCISLRAYEEKSCLSKLEYSKDGLFFVISQYVPYGKCGAVIEMVKKMDDEYVDDILDRELLYMNMDEYNQKIEMDNLTGVYNRHHLERTLPKYIETFAHQHKNIGLAMIDVDDFKSFNDNFGHLAGDQVLKEVAQVLESNIALSRGDFVTRFGGDEFLVVCLDISQDVFIRRMHTVAELVRHIEVASKKRVHLSVGCVNTIDFPEKDAKALVEIADKRLYVAKNTGKNQVITNDDLVTATTGTVNHHDIMSCNCNHNCHQ